MAEITDTALHALLDDDPERGWRAFVDQYTDTLVALIECAGVIDRDDVTEVYVRTCERLAENGCARLRRHDSAKGPLAAWLTIVVRHVVVDWLRTERGRRRLFGAMVQLDELHQRVFELFYWEHRPAREIAEVLTMVLGRPISLTDVLEALARIDRAMTDRHRAELLALVARTSRPLSLDVEDASLRLVPVDARPDPEQALRAKQVDSAFAGALAELPAEDAAIVRLKFVQGWSRDGIRRALGIADLTPDRIARILAALRARLAARGIGRSDTANTGLGFFEQEPT